MTNHTRLPLTVVGGFLGSGKTTLLNHVLSAAHGYRVMVMVNDFGELNIDAALIAASNPEQGVIELTNGCVCCAMNADLTEALIQAEQRAHALDWIIIEGSGVSDPAKIAQIGKAGGVFDLRSIVTVVDAAAIKKLTKDRYLGDMVQQQIRTADVVVLNKADLVDPVKGLELEQWLAQLAPHACVVQSQHSHVDWHLLFDPQHQEQAACEHDCTDPTHDHGTAHTQVYNNFIYELEQQVDLASFKKAVEQIEGIYRLKGVLGAGANQSATLVQYTLGGGVEMEPIAHVPERLKGRLLVIGTNQLTQDVFKKAVDATYI